MRFAKTLHVKVEGLGFLHSLDALGKTRRATRGCFPMQCSTPGAARHDGLGFALSLERRVTITCSDNGVEILETRMNASATHTVNLVAADRLPCAFLC